MPRAITMRAKYRINRRAALGGMAAGALLSVVPGARVSAQSLARFVFQTNWRAEGAHGGYYQAVASGIYRRYGLDCVIRPGGPNMIAQQILMGGAADAIMSTGFNAFYYVRNDLPFVCAAAMLQKCPSALMAHPGMGNDSFEQLRGKRILVSADWSTANNYWAILRRRFGYSDDQLRPYTYNLAPFLVDKNVVQQAFVSTEPYMARKAGIEPVLLMMADLGIGDYTETIDTSRKMIEEKPDLLQRFIDASIEGWVEYLKSSDISDVVTLIKRDNKDISEDEIAYSRQIWIKLGIVFSGDALQLGIGAMSDERWAQFSREMVAIGAFPADFPYRRAFTLQFVNKRVGLA